MSQQRSGGCLCGGVRFVVTGPPLNVRACHCRICQKVTGQPFYARALFHRQAVEVAGTTGVYPTSPGLNRHFCQTCGTTLFSHRHASPNVMGVALAAFDDPEAFKPTEQIWVSSQMSWARIGDLPCHEEAAP